MTTLVKNPNGLHQLSLLLLLLLLFPDASAQDSITVDGSSYQRYSKKYFRPHRGISYTLYASPVVTVDPLELGGKSTYALSLGSRFAVWESKTPDKKLTGLKMQGIYLALGYEFYPQQYDKLYTSTWIRVKTFLPLAFKTDLIYAMGNGLTGISNRFCIGIEIKQISLFLCGETYYFDLLGGLHPNFETRYTNAGEILAVIPLYHHPLK
jgi:hypothetical protein